MVNEVFKDTELVLAVRMELNKQENHYFPHALNKNPERYMAVKIGLERSTFELFESKDTEKFVFDSLNNLKLSKTW